LKFANEPNKAKQRRVKPRGVRKWLIKRTLHGWGKMGGWKPASGPEECKGRRELKRRRGCAGARNLDRFGKQRKKRGKEGGSVKNADNDRPSRRVQGFWEKGGSPTPA